MSHSRFCFRFGQFPSFDSRHCSFRLRELVLVVGSFCAIFLSDIRRYISAGGGMFVRRILGGRSSIVDILARYCY
jgi:hypothetical protein